MRKFNKINIFPILIISIAYFLTAYYLLGHNTPSIVNKSYTLNATWCGIVYMAYRRLFPDIYFIIICFIWAVLTSQIFSIFCSS